ncbi:MAG: nuclear transport factor 2 family protein [Pseudomonadota bacterium]
MPVPKSALITTLCAAALLILAVHAVHASENAVAASDAADKQALAAVGKRIAGYNAHDLHAFLAAHAEQVAIYEYPDKRIGTGREHLEFVFADQFASSQGHIDVLHQIVVGNRVISHEHITIGARVEQLVVVYTVDQGLITAFRLIE